MLTNLTLICIWSTNDHIPCISAYHQNFMWQLWIPRRYFYAELSINANHMINMQKRAIFLKQFWTTEVFISIVYAYYRDRIICCRRRCLCIVININIYIYVCVYVCIYVYVCAQACPFINVYEHVLIFTYFICDIVFLDNTTSLIELDRFIQQWTHSSHVHARLHITSKVMALLTQYPGPLFTYIIQLYSQHGYVIASIMKGSVGWNYTPIPNFQRLHHWHSGRDE